MAKLARNRGMFFGSWDGKAVTEAVSFDVGDSTGVTEKDTAIVAATFGTAVGGKSGEYNFIFDGTDWDLNSKTVAAEDMLKTYGITVGGTAAANDIIVVTYTAASGGWEALGKDNDELTKELNPDTETSKNVLGEVTFTHSGYESEISADPYYVDPGKIMYKRLLDIGMREVYSEADCLGKFAEAYFTSANKETQKMMGYCYVRDAWFVPESVGGDTSGLAIPVTITPVGAMKKCNIVYDMSTNAATITDIT